jgi:micrococcal nuclease
LRTWLWRHTLDVFVRHLFALLVLAFTAAVIAASAQPAPERAFTYRGTVTSVVDGDTLAVRLDNGRRERVRLIGIDTPERGACLAAQATAQASRLANRRRVVLRGDATQDTRDRYGRLLAYAWVRGRDLGYQQIAAGVAQVYVYDRPFQRLSAYRRAEQLGRGRPQNVWRGCTPTAAPLPPPSTPPPPASPPAGNCDASYPTVCIPPPPPDLDCADVPHTGFAVRGADPHRFDGDGDRLGCE